MAIVPELIDGYSSALKHLQWLNKVIAKLDDYESPLGEKWRYRTLYHYVQMRERHVAALSPEVRKAMRLQGLLLFPKVKTLQ